MTTPTTLSPDELDTAFDSTLSGNLSGGDKLRAHISAMESEHRALLADNAAMLQAMLDVADMRLSGPTLVSMASKLRSEPHPGAALLSEMEALRKRLAEMEAKHTAQVEWAQKCEDQRVEAERERDEAREQAATARAAALDEVATEAAYRADLARRVWPNSEQGNLPATALTKLAGDIRASITTPPPPVVPVAKVRDEALEEAAMAFEAQYTFPDKEVAAAIRALKDKPARRFMEEDMVASALRKIGRDVYTAPVPYVIEKAAEELGITLDGET